MDGDREQDRKTQLEIQKLELENQRLQAEIESDNGLLRRFVLPIATPLSIVVTVLIAVVGWNISVTLQNQQAADEAVLQNQQAQAEAALQSQRAQAEDALQNKQAQHDFELRIAEVILNAASPDLAVNRSRALLALFPGQFSPDFKAHLEALKPRDYNTGESEASVLQDRQMQMDIRLHILDWVLKTRAEDEPLYETFERFFAALSEFEQPTMTAIAAPYVNAD